MNPLHLSLLSLVSLLPLSSADFLIANTTLCMGAFPFTSCYSGAQVLAGPDPTHDFTCDHLVPAQDDHFVQPDRMGLLGANNTHVEHGLCGVKGRLNFLRDGPEYIAFDAATGETVGNCKVLPRDTDPSHAVKCPQLLGNIFFRRAYLCTSSVCA